MDNSFFVYVDYLLFWSRYEANIRELDMALGEEEVDIEQEDDSAVFLWVKLVSDAVTGLFEIW